MRFLLPLVVAAVVVVFLGWGLTMNPHRVQSPLIGEPAPSFSVSTVADPDAVLTARRFRRHEVSLFNVWASWCIACRREHGFLMWLSRNTDVPIYGLNYKDTRADARAWLARYGDPYIASAFDPQGKVAFDWGVYGAPETFVIDGNGIIRYKHIGPLTREVWRQTIRPIVKRLQGESG